MTLHIVAPWRITRMICKNGYSFILHFCGTFLLHYVPWCVWFSYTCVNLFYYRREHLSEEELRKNKVLDLLFQFIESDAFIWNQAPYFKYGYIEHKSSTSFSLQKKIDIDIQTKRCMRLNSEWYEIHRDSEKKCHDKKEVE